MAFALSLLFLYISVVCCLGMAVLRDYAQQHDVASTLRRCCINVMCPLVAFSVYLRLFHLQLWIRMTFDIDLLTYACSRLMGVSPTILSFLLFFFFSFFFFSSV